MNIDFKRCIENRKLVKVQAEADIIEKEFTESQKDLEKSKKSLENKDYKWAIIQAYYSMFHSAKALIYAAGYKEKSHQCLLVGLESLYVETNKIELEYVDMFRNSMRLRNDADYGMIYSPRAAERSVADANGFVEKTRMLLKFNSKK